MIEIIYDIILGDIPNDDKEIHIRLVMQQDSSCLRKRGREGQRLSQLTMRNRELHERQNQLTFCFFICLLLLLLPIFKLCDHELGRLKFFTSMDLIFCQEILQRWSYSEIVFFSTLEKVC